MLFDPNRHEALGTVPWDEVFARQAVQHIVADTLLHFDAQTLWPTHPRDLEPGEAKLPVAALYHGAAGVIWALERLRDKGGAAVVFDFGPTVAGLLEHNRRFNAASEIDKHSYLLGDSGVLLLQFKHSGSKPTARVLFELVKDNLHNPTHEALWGSPGTLVAALHMLEATGEERWLQVFRRGVDILWEQMHPAAGFDDTWV